MGDDTGISGTQYSSCFRKNGGAIARGSKVLVVDERMERKSRYRFTVHLQCGGTLCVSTTFDVRSLVAQLGRPTTGTVIIDRLQKVGLLGKLLG